MSAFKNINFEGLKYDLEEKKFYYQDGGAPALAFPSDPFESPETSAGDRKKLRKLIEAAEAADFDAKTQGSLFGEEETAAEATPPTPPAADAQQAPAVSLVVIGYDVDGDVFVDELTGEIYLPKTQAEADFLEAKRARSIAAINASKEQKSIWDNLETRTWGNLPFLARLKEGDVLRGEFHGLGKLRYFGPEKDFHTKKIKVDDQGNSVWPDFVCIYDLDEKVWKVAGVTQYLRGLIGDLQKGHLIIIRALGKTEKPDGTGLFNDYRVNSGPNPTGPIQDVTVDRFDQFQKQYQALKSEA